MGSVCWTCRLKLLGSATSRRSIAETSRRVPLSQRYQLLSVNPRSAAPTRSLHQSARLQFPRGRTTSGSQSRRQRDRPGAYGTGEGEKARDAQVTGDNANRLSRQRHTHGSIAGHEADAADNENLESNVRLVRQTFKDYLPEGLLDEDGLRVYERLYGSPTRIVSREELEEAQRAASGQREGAARLMRKTEEGDLEEVATSSHNGTSAHEEQELGSTSYDPAVDEIDDQVLLEYSEALRQQAMDEGELTTSQRELLSNDAISAAFDARAEELMEEEDAEEEEAAQEDADEDEDPDVWPGDEHRVRTHPLTAMGRFCTSPTAVELPRDTFVEPITKAVASATTRQMRQVAEHIFGGPGLPYSPATPRRALTMPQKPIPMLASNKSMNDMESYVYATTVMPGVYASVLGVLTETRKRLGTTWIRDLMYKDGGPLILDAGAGGAGALAWRALLKAEWEVMHEEAAMHGTIHPVSSTPPTGKATVLTASSSLRNRMTPLLDNTTFIPRMPEAVKADVKEQRKQYDLIIAPHTLWPLEKDYMRKLEVDKLWSLLNPDGGVLVLLEKGVPRGFEVIGGARAHLLKRHIADPIAATAPIPESSQDIYSANEEDAGQVPSTKEQGMIVAPCTNHGPCPMYKYAGVSQARKNWCYFSQRFVRPPYLQHILGAKKRNHDDVEFSYVVVQRGRDLRQAQSAGATEPLVQGLPATDRAFEGYEAFTAAETGKSAIDNDEISLDEPLTPFSSDDTSSEPSSAVVSAPHPLTLPRLILPPLKRKKHVIIDICTPSATLERWTVTKGFSAQAYRDARKSSWGDLWALGAKHRMVKRVDLGKQVKQMEEMERRKAQGKERRGEGEGPGLNVEMDRRRKKDAKRKRRKEGRKKVDLLDV